jgi:uncharacterized membrane protein
MPVLSIGDCIRFGWETFKQRPWILIGALFLCMLLPSVPNMLVSHPLPEPGQPLPPPTAADLIAGLSSMAIGVLTSLGATTFALRAHDNIATVKFSDLWNPEPFWRFLGAEILVALILTAGFILLVIPGIIASLGLSFVTFLVVDRAARPIEAIKESWRITKGHKWQLFLLIVSLLLLNVLGLIALFVGLLVTVPITWLAVTHAYRTLSGPGVAPTR